MARSVIENPIINRPYDAPSRHWRFDDQGLITNECVEGRRASESWVPVPPPRKRTGKFGQEVLDLDGTRDRRKKNEDVDRLRADVDLWRKRGWPGITAATRKLLEYWTDPDRDNKILFCQREAVETAIYLAEAAGDNNSTWATNTLREANREHNDGLPRMALKMATGSGKTVVMAMLIAWHTVNKAANRNDARFTNRFLVVTPGITIRDRLRVLRPGEDDNYYRLRDLVPADEWTALRGAQIVVTNFHAFGRRTTGAGKTAAANTRALLASRTGEDPFVETSDQMVNRVLRPFGPPSRTGQIVVLCDEAHHCYRPRASALGGDAAVEDDLTGEDRKEASTRNSEAGMWFTGLREIARKTGLKQVFDLSATPYFLKGSGYPEGYLFPWVVSDFSLMDAIESGIVKIPRVPVDDNAVGDEVTYLHLWPQVKDDLPTKLSKGAALPRILPPTLETAIASLYRDYERDYEAWAARSSATEEPPPVFIVVCNNTTVSRMVFEHVSGRTESIGGSNVHHSGEYPLLSNHEAGAVLPRPPSILIDSLELESGDALSPAFRAAAEEELAVFAEEYAARTGRDRSEVQDADILREVMNTVGKPGRLGGEVRCVVSVSMLTEGWDANTVTHILGVRAFASQLLCEQVVGRGLRRRSYAINGAGFFEPEYAQVYGVPFSFIRLEPGDGDPVPPKLTKHVHVMPDRDAGLRITFPRVEAYRIETPDDELHPDFEDLEPFAVTLDGIATRVQVAGIIGAEDEHDLGWYEDRRENEIAFHLARHLLERFADEQGSLKPWLFPRLVEISREWLTTKVRYAPGTYPGLLLIKHNLHHASGQIFHRTVSYRGSAVPVVRAVLQATDPVGSTDDIDFHTTKACFPTSADRSPVNYVVLDGQDGNTWEAEVARVLEDLPEVASYVKNDHLELAVPYLHAGKARRYLPDFVVTLRRRLNDVQRTLLVEVSGTRKSALVTKEKADTARNLWCAGVNNLGGYGRWGYTEITSPAMAGTDIAEAVRLLYADAPITGLPSVV